LDINVLVGDALVKLREPPISQERVIAIRRVMPVECVGRHRKSRRANPRRYKCGIKNSWCRHRRRIGAEKKAAALTTAWGIAADGAIDPASKQAHMRCAASV
jgi:hypothetical protein